MSPTGFKNIHAWWSDDKVPLRFLGFGFIWAWAYLMFFSPVICSSSGDATTISIISMSATASAALCTLFLVRYFPSLLSKHFLIVAPLLAFIGTLLVAVFFGGTSTASHVLVVIGSILAGIGSVWVQLLWAVPYKALELREAATYTCLSFVVAIILYFLIALGMQHILAIGLTALLPAISAFLSVPLYKETVSVDSDIGRPLSPIVRHTVVLIFIGIALYATAHTFVRYLIAPTDSIAIASYEQIWLAFGGLAAILLTIAIMAFPKIPFYALSYVFVLPMMVAGFLLLSFVGLQGGVNSPIFAAQVCFNVFLWILLSDISRKVHTSAITIFGWGLAISSGVGALGGALGTLVAQNPNFFPNLLIISFITIMVLILAAPLLFSNKVLSDISPDEAMHDGDLPEDSGCQQLSAIVERFDLTARETEVLALLLKGRSVVFIQTELCIAPGTARAHVRNIYGKLGVHSHDELLDVIETC